MRVRKTIYPTTWTKEMFREKRARQRAEAIAAGTSTAGIGRRPKADMEEIPPEVFERGRLLRAMMRTPACMWPAEWTEDL